MKNITKVSYMFLVGIIALLFGSCTDSYDYTPAGATGVEAYFDNSQPSTIEVSKNANSFGITVSRVKTDGELTVPLNFTPGEGNVFTVPSSVTFADGQAQATINITYNPNDIQYGVYSGGTIALGDGIDTTYGIGTFTFKAGATEWADFDNNKSMGLMREDALTTWFSWSGGTPIWDVHIQKSVINEGMYRIVEPYSDMFSQEQEGGNTDAKYDTSKEHYWVINATDPDYVYLETCSTGLDLGYGEITLTSMVQYFLDTNEGLTIDVIKQQRPDLFGTLKDGVITMPTKSLAASMAEYNNGQFVYAGNNGLFAVALPGHIIADYSLEAAYKGRFTDDTNTDYATIALTFGDDVASVKSALVTSTTDVNTTAQGIISGDVKSVETTASGNIQIAYNESGKYNLVCVIYNAAGETVGTQSFTFDLKSSKDNVETYNDIAAGTLTIGAENLIGAITSQDISTIPGEPMEVESVLSQSASDPTKFRLQPYLPIDASMSTTLDFTVDADGNIYVDSQVSGLTGKNQSGQQEGIVISDIITYVGGPGSQSAQRWADYASKYDSDEDTYYFRVLYHSPSEDGIYAFELDKYEVLDRTEAAAIKKAYAAAKKAAASHKYIFRTEAHHGIKLDSFNNGNAKKAGKRTWNLSK